MAEELKEREAFDWQTAMPTNAIQTVTTTGKSTALT